MTMKGRAVCIVGLALWIGTGSLPSALRAQPQAWQEEQVTWQAGNGRRVKAIRYPQGDRPPMGGQEQDLREKTRQSQAMPVSKRALSATEGTPVLSLAVDNPPVAGFVPWIAISVTTKRGQELDMDAVVETGVVGSYPSGVVPEQDYMMGIFDTGASAHVVGYTEAQRAGITGSLLTSNQSTVYGVLGSVDVWISQPLGLFVDGLGAIDPASLLADPSNMMGESNVAIIVGDNPFSSPDLATAIGTPLSVYFTTVIRNDRIRTIVRNDQVYSGPEVRLYESYDPRLPTYENVIPLELRPLGGVGVQYTPSLDLDFDWDDLFGGDEGASGPSSPSVIMGLGSQSLFFVASVDLYEGSRVAMDKDRFMLDTGAQVTVIGSRIAARLGLSPANAEFEVEIQDVTGEVVMAPGFYVDSIQIPALGEWLVANQVPVVLLDVFSPEGGSLDGIIGTNLFLDFNLVLRGGGLFYQDDPALEFGPIDGEAGPDGQETLPATE